MKHKIYNSSVSLDFQIFSISIEKANFINELIIIFISYYTIRKYIKELIIINKSFKSYHYTLYIYK